MHKISYGNSTIEYQFILQEGLKSHYISVEKNEGVVLKGSQVSVEKANQLILKKARWILDKMELVKAVETDEWVTGSRMQYLGRKYYVEIILQENLSAIRIDFTASRFKVYAPPTMNQQAYLQAAFDGFLAAKAQEKLPSRVRKWAKETGLEFHSLQVKPLEKRWGSCTPSNKIVLNTAAIQLPYSLIDYLIVHELAHTREKNHSKAFWAIIASHIPNWRELDERMSGMKM